MSPPKPPIHQADDSGFKLPELPLHVLKRCDSVCMEFEAGWQQGKITPIERMLNNKEGDERTYLLYHLLGLELFYRSQNGSIPGSSEYERRFPKDRPVVRQAFVELNASQKSADPFAETSSFNDEAILREMGAVTCPECQEQISAEEIEPGVVTCNLCGSTFVYSPIPSMSGSGIVLPTMIGRYRIVGLLGSGAFGTVYKAEDTKLKNIVALKFPQHWESYSEEGKNRFDREAKAAAALRHDHIVPVLNIGDYNGIPYIVSSFIDGTTLAEHLNEREEPLPIAEGVALIKKIAEALHFAHTNKVFHRDVKPGNILVDLSGRPFLTDFGLARWEGDDLTITQADQFLGTWAYASPEQALMKNKEVKGRSDIFSLGIVLYELLTGQRPFRAKNSAGIQDQILNETPQAPRKLNPKIPKDLETICLKCLEKLPEKRYQTAGELAEDLQRVLDQEPVKARRVSPLERGWRWCRKNYVTTLLVLALVALSLTWIILALNTQTVTPPPLNGPTFEQKVNYLSKLRERAFAVQQEEFPDIRAMSMMQPNAPLWSDDQRLKLENLLLEECKCPDSPYGTNFEFLKACLQDEKARIREAAAETAEMIVFIGDLQTILEEMAISDPEPLCQIKAKEAIDAITAEPDL